MAKRLLGLFSSVLLLSACNSGGSWNAGSLGTLSINIANTNLSVNQTTQVTATLSNAYQGTDPIGGATIQFYVWNSFESGSAPVPSNIAVLAPQSCTINNPLASTNVSCSVNLTGVIPGSSRVYVQAIPTLNTNTQGPVNNYIFESFTVTP